MSGAPAPLVLGVEAAHIIGALTDAEELAHGVLARPALSPTGLSVEKLARLVSPEAARTAAALQDLGELGLPRNWSAAQAGSATGGDGAQDAAGGGERSRLVLARLAEHLVQVPMHPLATRASASGSRLRRAPSSRRSQAAWVCGKSSGSLRIWRFATSKAPNIGASPRRSKSGAPIASSTFSAVRGAALSAQGRAYRGGGVRTAQTHHSIYRKMQTKRLGFEELFDVRAVRIIVASIPTAMRLGSRTRPLAQRSGAVRRLHCDPKGESLPLDTHAVIGPQHMSVEIQIRTREMHQQAELGVAAHWHYKEAVRAIATTRARSNGCGGSSSPLPRRMRSGIFSNACAPSFLPTASMPSRQRARSSICPRRDAA